MQALHSIEPAMRIEWRDTGQTYETMSHALVKTGGLTYWACVQTIMDPKMLTSYLRQYRIVNSRLPHCEACDRRLANGDRPKK